MEDRDPVREEFHLGNLARLGGFDFTDTFHMYTSSQIGPYYVQGAVAQKDGEYFRKVNQDLSFLVMMDLEEIDSISGGESRDWMFSANVANYLTLPHLMVYKDGKLLGAHVEGQRFGHVADLNNEGSSFRDKWAPSIRDNGGTLDKAYFYVERMEEGVQVLENLGIKERALIHLDSVAWDILKKQGVLSAEDYSNLMRREEMGNHEWAVDMLRSEGGIKRFNSFYKSPDEKIRKRAQGILDVGYPELREEVLERIAA